MCKDYMQKAAYYEKSGHRTVAFRKECSMMTDYENVSVRRWGNCGITASEQQNGNAMAEGTFADALKSEKPSSVKVSCAPPDTAPNIEIPERWGNEGMWGYAFVLKNTLDYLNNELGIDTSKRTPTHTITNEQREWLASRHDLEALKNSTRVDTPEMAQLFGDLVFLNVISASDVCNTMIPLPPISGGQTSLGICWGDIDNFPEDTDLLLERVRKYIEFNRQVFELNKGAWSIDYIEGFDSFVKTLEECHEVLSDLFYPVTKKDEAVELRDNRNVTDASEQFKADFGSFLK